MKSIKFIKFIWMLIACCAFIAGGGNVMAQTSAGTIISNFAEASYKNLTGETFNTISPTVNFRVRAVSALIVTPDETENSEIVTANQTITKKFRVCNTSNITDTYTLTQANITSPAQIIALYYDVDNDGEISNADVLISLNNTLSPSVTPGTCINILAQVNTNNISLNDRLNINITVRSNNPETANGLVEDSGTIINAAGKPASFTDPNNPTLIPLKLVENQASYIANKNQPLNYLIAFRNSGDVAAKNVVIIDELPNQLNYIPNSLRVDGVSLTDNEDADEGSVINDRLVIKLTNPVAPGQIVRVNFQAVVVVNNTPGIGIVNIANVSASNAVAVNTTQAVTVVDPFGTVYAARSGASAPISNARVAISTAQNNENLLSIPKDQGFEPNTANSNPYFTNSEGRFSFGLHPNQLGNTTQAATYFVTVSAESFRPRLLQISLSPNGNGTFKMIVRSMDGMPIAIANGFELTENEVQISSIADVAMNIPMFENTTLELTKTADRAQVEVGDLINYQVEIHNASVAPLFETMITDTLPDSFSYAPDTAQIKRNGVTQLITPEISGNVMHFDVGKIDSGERFLITYRVRVGVNVRPGESFNTATGKGRFPTGEVIQTAPAKVGVKVNAGLFSMRQFILGRVFIDENGNQLFDKDEKPVVGARIYLATGESVITDSQGMYNLPAVSEGSQSIAIDPITLPQGYLLADNNSRSGKDWTRLLRTPLGGGSMLRQNFVLIASKENPPVSTVFSDDNDAKKIEKQPIESGENVLVQPKVDEVKIVKADFDKDSLKPETTTEYHPIPTGDVLLHGLVENQLIMTPAFNLEVSVTLNWKALVELNGNKISDQTIGSTREDRKNQITSYIFVGLGLKPGPNRLSVTAVNSEGILGKTTEITIYGRGSTKRLLISADKKELEASGRDATRIIIRAIDEWGHPAQDTSIDLQTSAGRLVKPEEYAENRQAVKDDKLAVGQDVTSTVGITSEQTNEIARQQSVEIKRGIGYVKLVSDNQTGVADLKVILGNAKAETQVQFIPELRPAILNSLAEITIGKNAPEMQNRNVDEKVRGHVQFFYKGQLFGSSNMLTLAYDSQQPLNRVSGSDRLFQLNPLDRVYPIFGDSSTRFQETESNSKVYARLDRGRSYAMFGDFEADMERSRLLGYGRRLTGVKLHLENDNGDFITATGARPDTSFARQVIKGGTLGIVQLLYPDLMPGSELLTIETRDRRNPEIILSREYLTRGLDYNLDTTSGTIFFLRPIPTFDRDLNLVQVVATYEYRSNGFESSVYTARASKTFNNLGLRLGLSFIDQHQADAKPFRLGGLDMSLKLPNNGKLEAEWAISNGSVNSGFGFSGNNPNGDSNHNGNAFYVNLEQPLDFWQSTLRFEGAKATENYFNPFGATITPGATREIFSLESTPFNNGTFKVNLIGEQNKTENVDNNRLTAGISWTQVVNEKIRLNFGYDLRRFSDNKDDKTVISNLLTIGAEYKPTDKIDFSVKREQNLGEADPSYPSQTTFTANYRFTDNAKLFFTQRLSGAAITPIADVSGTGFGFSKANNETAIGVETRFGKYTSMSGRYLLENGINGTDSFAVAGLMNRLPIRKNLSLELGFERAFHLKGEGKSYNNIVLGANYLPSDSFRTSFRYELRDRDGLGQIFSFGAAGILKAGWTVLGNYRYGNINFQDRQNRISNGQLAMAIRPHDTDKYGLLLSYQRRDSYYSDGKNLPNILKSDVISADGFHQTTKRLELYGRFALKFSGDGNTNLPYANNFTYLVQGRAQYLLSRDFDVAVENRFMYQPSSGSQKNWFGAELGYWVTPDLRFGVGYNFSRNQEPIGFNNNNVFNKNGLYFVISSKMSRLFNLFGTKKDGLQYTEEKEFKLSPKPTN